MRRASSRRARAAAAGAFVASLAAVSAALPPAAAARGRICRGTRESPGVLTGHLAGNLTVNGVCAVNAGASVVGGTVRVSAGSALLADFGLNHRSGRAGSSLTVKGSLYVAKGGVLLLGCESPYSPCADDPNPAAPTLGSHAKVYGDLIEHQPLGVVVHAGWIAGHVSEGGGGGGLTCNPSGIFAEHGFPPYSDYEDTTIGHGLSIAGLSGCWLGVIRNHVRGGVRILSNRLADPDAIEVLANHVSGGLACAGNSNVRDSTEAAEGGVYPRVQEPNTVSGKRSGQCVLESPASEGGAPGPGPF